MQKHVNLVDLIKSFPTNIYLQNLASIQKRTSPARFAHLAEKSENGSISNLSTKVRPPVRPGDLRESRSRGRPKLATERAVLVLHHQGPARGPFLQGRPGRRAELHDHPRDGLRQEGNALEHALQRQGWSFRARPLRSAPR